MLYFLSSVLVIQMCPFLWSVWCYSFHILVLFFGDFAVKLVPKHSAQVLSSVPKCKKTAVLYVENTCVREIHPGMNYSAVICEFNVTESTIYVR